MLDFNQALDTKTKSPSVSLSTQDALLQIGERLRIARLRRRQTAGSVAQRIGVSLSTYKRMELGGEGIAVGALFEALALFGFSSQLFALGDPALDQQGEAYDAVHRPRRGRH